MKRTKPKLTTAQALTREIRRLEHLWAPRLRGGGPARFIQCWAVSGRPVTQALDEDGLVWELHTVIDKATGQVTEQFWTQLGMERRA